MYNRSSKRKSEIDNRVQALFEEMCVCVCVCVWARVHACVWAHAHSVLSDSL